MRSTLMALKDIKPNPNNPRTITDHKFKKLVTSIKEFPKMLELRPIVIDDDNVVLGGNMRLKACTEAGLKEVHVIKASDLTEEQKREFIIKDNVGFGEWDWDLIANEWNEDQVNDWGLDTPTIKNTELLSGMEYDTIYYEPEITPDIDLKSCVNFEKFNQKLEAINDLDLTDEQKEIFKLFAYRFLKIDFENVANYYFFNATENEKLAIERLRLVLTDNGLNGFLQDDLLRVLNFTDVYLNDLDND